MTNRKEKKKTKYTKYYNILKSMKLKQCMQRGKAEGFHTSLDKKGLGSVFDSAELP